MNFYVTMANSVFQVRGFVMEQKTAWIALMKPHVVRLSSKLNCDATMLRTEKWIEEKFNYLNS